MVVAIEWYTDSYSLIIGSAGLYRPLAIPIGKKGQSATTYRPLFRQATNPHLVWVVAIACTLNGPLVATGTNDFSCCRPKC